MSEPKHAPEGAALARKPRRKATPEELAERARLHESRVDYVADMMRNLKFRTGVTTKRLAVEWDLPYGEAGRISVEASRRVRAEYADHDATLARGLPALDQVIEDALAAGDRKSIIAAVALWAQVTGAGAPQKHQIQQEIAAMSPEQLAARKAELVKRLTGKDIQVKGPVPSEDDDAAR